MGWRASMLVAWVATVAMSLAYISLPRGGAASSTIAAFPSYAVPIACGAARSWAPGVADAFAVPLLMSPVGDMLALYLLSVTAVSAVAAVAWAITLAGGGAPHSHGGRGGA